VLGGLAHVERRVLEEGGNDEVGVALGHPPRDDAAQRVPHEHRGAADRLAQHADDVLAVVVDVVGAWRVLRAAVAAQVDAHDPPTVGDLARQPRVGPHAARHAVQEDDRRAVRRSFDRRVEPHCSAPSRRRTRRRIASDEA
jgi:hypothetical protein